MQRSHELAMKYRLCAGNDFHKKIPKSLVCHIVFIWAGTNTPSDEYDTYREYRVANTNMYSRIHFFSEAKLGNGLSVLVYACTMYSAQKFHFANLVYSRTPDERPPSPTTIPLIRPHFV